MIKNLDPCCVLKLLRRCCRHCLHLIVLDASLYLTMKSKVTGLPFFWEQKITINSGCLPIFSPITFKEGKTDTTNNDVTPLMTNTNHNTV